MRQGKDRMGRGAGCEERGEYGEEDGGEDGRGWGRLV